VRCERQICLQEAFELHERFIIKDNRVEVRESTVRLIETVTYSVAGEGKVMFFPCKPLFLRGGQNRPIADHTGGVIMVKG
jgi:hypothetical protein